MTLSVKSGSFTLNAATGNQAVTGVGFQPTLVLFWGGLAADGAPSIATFGCAMSSSSRWAIGWHSADGAGSSDASREWETAQCIAFPKSDGTGAKVAADFVSMDADGFTINIGTTDATQYRIHYLAMAGADLSAKIGSFTLTTGTGNLAITGVGFQPKAVIFVNGINSTSTGASAATLISMGAARSSSAQWGISFTEQDSASPSEVGSIQVTTACHVCYNVAGVIDVAEFVSNDADGFTVNKTTKDGTQRTIGYLALGGDCNFGVGTITEPSTTTTLTTSLGFAADALMFFSTGAAASASLSTTHNRMCIGAAVSSSDQRVQAYSATDNVATTETASGVDEDECVMSITGGTPTRAMLGELTAISSTGFTLSFSAVSGNNNQICYLAIADVAEGSFESTGAMTGSMAQSAILTPSVTLGTGAMTGAMAATQISDRTFASTGGMTGAMAAALIRDTSFNSTGAMTGTMTAIATLLAEFSSTAHIMNFFVRANAEFDVWAVTLDPGADGSKRYAAYPFTNFDFNSFATLDGLTFAAGDGGTFVLGDTDDDGTDIDAWLQTGKSNVGTDRDKRAVVAYVIGTCEEPPMVEAEDGSGNTYEYEGRTNAPDEPQRIKVKMGRGMKGGMWGWKIKNQDGSDFDISDLMVDVDPLSRRVR